MTSNFISSLSLPAWRCNATKHASFYDPLPADELEDASFAVLLHFVCPSSGPRVGTDKDVLPFITPCLLKVAPLTPKMQAKTGRLQGKQRSLAHVTEATFLIIDVDGLSQAEFDALLDKLRQCGITFAAYNTHSHGREDKPGVRARMLLPVDRATNADEYRWAWFGFDLIFTGGAIAANDDSGAAMWQQQGVWSAHPDRVELVFREVYRGGVVSADALIAAGEQVLPKTAIRTEYVSRPLSADEQTQRLVDALRWIDPDTTSTWILVVTALKALGPMIGFDNARELAVRYSERGSEDAKKHNDDARYDPATFFDNVQPTMPPEAAMGKLCALARDGALAEVKTGLASGEQLTDVQLQAAFYCGTHHRRAYDELLADFNLGGL